MKSFDINLAKQGNPVCTRDGQEVRIICFDKKATNFPIIGLVGNTDIIICYTEKGEATPSYNSRFDLFMGEEEHFDPAEFKPFDKVLVRDSNNCKWCCDFFSSFSPKEDYKFSAVTSYYRQCIPYNDETMNLLGTTENASKKYVNW